MISQRTSGLRAAFGAAKVASVTFAERATLQPLRVLASCLMAVVVLAPAPAACEAPPSLAQSLDGLPADQVREVLQWAADWVRQTLPESYHGEKDWGKKKRLYAGIQLDRVNGRLHTRRRWKEVGHGRWIRYDVHLRDPSDPQRLDIRVLKAEQGENQDIHFETQINTLVDLEVHQERWNLGTRLFSVSVKAQARLRLVVTGNVGFELDLSRIPPDLLIDPKIASTKLVLVDLKVNRVSKIGGEVAEAMGDIAEWVIREEYLPKQQAAIAAKLNTQIDRRRDRLRLGASEWINRSLPIASPPIASPPIASPPAAAP